MKVMSTAALLLSVIALNASANSTVTASNKIGLKFAAENAKLVKGKNFMLSPVSLQQALTLAGNGTGTATRTETEKLLGTPLEQLNADGKSFVKGISFSPAQKKELQEQNHWLNPAVVQIQNGMWTTNGKTDGRKFAFDANFKSIAKEYYAAETGSHDFKAQSGVDALNNWAKEKTYGLIPKIIDLDGLKPMLWVIMNATYIEASWKKAFSAIASDKANFTMEGGKKVTAKMIKSEQEIAYSKLSDGSELASIPFSTSSNTPELEFVVYLPSKSKTVAQAQKDFFTPTFWASTQKKLTSGEAFVKADVTLPKFSFDTSVEMKKESPLTKALGVKFLFEDTADFGPMATPDSLPSVVGLIKQNSRIELDEKGVKAAAVTLIGGMERTSMPVQSKVKLTLDRPFVFAIADKQSKAILFVGTLADPR